MNQITKADYELRQLKNKLLSRGVASIIVGSGICLLIHPVMLCIGGVIVLAGIGKIYESKQLVA